MAATGFTSGGASLDQIQSVAPAIVGVVAAAAFVATAVMIVRQLMKAPDEASDASDTWDRSLRILLFVLGISAIAGSGTAAAKFFYKKATSNTVAEGSSLLPGNWDDLGKNEKSGGTGQSGTVDDAIADTDATSRQAQERQLKAKAAAAKKAADAARKANEAQAKAAAEEASTGSVSSETEKEASDAKAEASGAAIANVWANGNTAVDNWDANGAKGYSALTGNGTSANDHS